MGSLCFMIPSVIIIAAIFRNWRIVAVAAVLWPIVVVMWGDVDSVSGFFGAGMLGAINAAIGVAIGTAVETVTRGLWTAASKGSR